MRVLAIFALASLLALVAFVPMAAAKPVPPECAEKDYTADPDVSFNRSCGVTVRWAPMSCPLSGSWKTYQVGNSYVSLYTCDGP